MRTSTIRSAYRRYAAIYDAVFGDVFEAGRRRATEIINDMAGPQRVLEIGVGTGLSLDLYRPDHRVVGIDLSPEMLKRAHDRVAKRHLPQVEALMEMNAEHLSFEDESFDVVAAMHVVSVVSDPQQVMREMQRVCKPGGTILIVNHFSDENSRIMSRLERMLAPCAGMLGWHPYFPFQPLLDGHDDLNLLSVEPQRPLGMFKVVRLRKETQAAAGEESVIPKAVAQ